MAKKTYDTRQLAELAGVSQRAVQHWIHQGQLAATYIGKRGFGGHFRVAAAEWQRFAKQRTARKSTKKEVTA